jgi:glycosyltransferase involved in cell wall biosynthesis
MPARCLHLLLSSEPCGARTWLLEELRRPANYPNDAVYVASHAGELPRRETLPALLANHWLELSQRPSDPLRWWQLLRWLQREQPAVIRFWFTPGPWLRRFIRFASPQSRWQVLFRSRDELPAAADRSWSALDIAWYDNPLLQQFAAETLPVTCSLLPGVAIGEEKVGEEKVSGTFSSTSSRAELREKLLARLKLPAESILLVTVGPFERDKNQDQLFWSLDQLSCTRDDVWLLMIGDGPDRARLEHHARLHHVNHRILWLGQVDWPAEYLRAAHLYVSADPREHVSRAMLEARAVGLPIIAHDTATNRQIVTAPEHGRLVDPTYLADYAGTIYRWLLAPQAQNI